MREASSHLCFCLIQFLTVALDHAIFILQEVRQQTEDSCGILPGGTDSHFHRLNIVKAGSTAKMRLARGNFGSVRRCLRVVLLVQDRTWAYSPPLKLMPLRGSTSLFGKLSRLKPHGWLWADHSGTNTPTFHLTINY